MNPLMYCETCKKDTDHINNQNKLYCFYCGKIEGETNEDIINKPRHYNLGIETVNYIESWSMNYIEGNIIKYVTRYKYKNGLEDLKKAEFYLKRLIKNIEEEGKKTQE